MLAFQDMLMILLKLKNIIVPIFPFQILLIIILISAKSLPSFNIDPSLSKIHAFFYVFHSVLFCFVSLVVRVISAHPSSLPDPFQTVSSQSTCYCSQNTFPKDTQFSSVSYLQGRAGHTKRPGHYLAARGCHENI